MKTLRQTSRNATMVQYADPDMRLDTVTVKNQVQPKKAGAVTVYNSKSNINIQRTKTLPALPGCADNCAPLNQEKLAGSVSFSGSTQSKDEMLLLWTDLKSIVDASFSDLSAGFLPDDASVTVGVVA